MPLTMGLTRREAIGAAAGAGFAGLLPDWALATPGQMAAEIARVLAGRTAKPGRIKLDLPSISENGAGVPIGFEVASPQTADEHVTAVHIFADGNPSPLVATYRFSAEMPKAAMQLRIRLAQTQLVTVMAEMSNGDVHMVQQDAKVTLGGCGG